MKLPRILMFPGQGSQALGMAVGWQASAAARLLLEEANEALGLDLGKLMAPEANIALLTQTQNAQPALLVVGLMAAAALAEATGKPLQNIAQCVAGHSLGEYTAVAAAGGMAVAQAVTLVRLRGEAMAQAPQGGMSAVLGLAPETLEEVLQGHPQVYFANDNCAGQAVISGALAALSAAEDALKAAGAKRVVRLPVGGAFHTPMQQPAAQAVATALAAQPLAALQLPCIMNFTAQAHVKNNEVAENLIQQIICKVRWRESMLAAAAQGITEAVELGCGKVLAGLAPRCDARLAAVSLATNEELLRWLEGQIW